MSNCLGTKASLRELKVLRHLDKKGASSFNDLSIKFSDNKFKISQVLIDLEEFGYISYKRKERDTFFGLTEEGKKCLYEYFEVLG